MFSDAIFPNRWTQPESVSGYISTSQPIRYMEEDVHTPGNILFTEDFAIKTTDGITTTTIAGSTSRSGSYREGTGSGASFSYLRGFAQIAGTKQVFTI